MLIASSEGELQTLLNRIFEARREAGVLINVGKTQVMCVSKTLPVNMNITLNGIPISQCTKYRYLGYVVNNVRDISREIRSRTEQVRNV